MSITAFEFPILDLNFVLSEFDSLWKSTFSLEFKLLEIEFRIYIFTFDIVNYAFDGHSRPP